MINEKLAKQIEQHKKRWKEHPEECPAEINSMSEKDVYDGIRSCTFLDTEIPGESKEDFVKRLKKEKKEKNKEKKISKKTKKIKRKTSRKTKRTGRLIGLFVRAG